MQLAARRLGCRILIHDADPSLRELIEQAGLGDILLYRDPGDANPGTFHDPDVGERRRSTD